MRIDFKKELNSWGVYFGIILLSVFIHELGHSSVAWANGYKSVPTPAKEYVFGTIPEHVQQWISLGGIIASVIVIIGIYVWQLLISKSINASVLGGVIAIPGIYTLRFLLQGRGHDSTEFQEAQFALGLNYSGHSIDWLFLVLFVAGIFTWYIKIRPKGGFPGRILLGIILAIIFLGLLQSMNNAIFDPFFEPKISK